MAELPEIKAAIETEIVEDEFSLKTFLPNRSYEYAREKGPMLILTFLDNGRASFRGYPDRVYRWRLKDERLSFSVTKAGRVMWSLSSRMTDVIPRQGE